MQHFIIQQDLSTERLHVLDKELLHQMKTVLRFRVGDACIILDGQGTQADGVIEELQQKGAIILLKNRKTCEAPRRRVRLYCALSKKPATFELIVQKASELGVTDIIPLVTERCQVRELRKTERLQLIIKEACEQSERCFIPRLHEVLKWEELLAKPPKGLLLAGDPWTYDKSLKEVVRPETEDLNLIIGPEGGLTLEELESVKQAGGTLFLLGKTVLRMETAAIAALSVVMYA